ncbi:helix-turn-helix domain-containing protein [Bradyrhizobium sp. CCGB12]|uniref:helix-turn-helix domain-containing protein n=1 Tax=Bradyrhizobium sp. CCGB12 TaxID=2949632 RepID=UPI0020B22516|nr:helix-turn-helix domain-containing protein [Bradyrhizobium sp. CCGB12]MCP3390504.1 helix-turn-helix domain-containing protein [Bradyrhizobium sp. CCGB12]
MPLSRLQPSPVLRIERFSDFSAFRANEVLGLGKSTPLRPREFSLSRAILPLREGLFVFQRCFARRYEAEIGTDNGFGLVVPFSFNSIANGDEVDSSMIALMRGKAAVDAIEHNPNTYLMLRFNSDMRHRGWGDFDTGMKYVRTQNDPMARLRAAILEMYAQASVCSDPRHFAALNRPIQETLIAGLDAALLPAEARIARPGSFDKHRRLIARLDEVVEFSGSKPLYSDDLAAAIGVSVRTLQIAAQAVHGVSLHHYLRLKRLWSVRVQLMTGGDGVTVKAAALGNGFWHLGDFAKGYRRLFGEAPSETLARGRRPFRLGIGA